MIRFVQIALLVAVMIPVAWAIRSATSTLPDAASWLLAGIPIGMALMMALNAWDRRIRQRAGEGSRSD